MPGRQGKEEKEAFKSFHVAQKNFILCTHAHPKRNPPPHTHSWLPLFALIKHYKHHIKKRGLQFKLGPWGRKFSFKFSLFCWLGIFTQRESRRVCLNGAGAVAWHLFFLYKMLDFWRETSRHVAPHQPFTLHIASHHSYFIWEKTLIFWQMGTGYTGIGAQDGFEMLMYCGSKSCTYYFQILLNLHFNTYW